MFSVTITHETKCIGIWVWNSDQINHAYNFYIVHFFVLRGFQGENFWRLVFLISYKVLWLLPYVESGPKLSVESGDNRHANIKGKSISSVENCQMVKFERRSNALKSEKRNLIYKLSKRKKICAKIYVSDQNR